MHRFLLILFISVTIVFFACAAERDEPAPSGEPSGEITTTEEPAMTPADTVNGSVTSPAGVNVPGVETGEAVRGMTTDGASSTFVDNRFLYDLVSAIIMNDMEVVEGFSTDEFFEDIDKTIAEIGLRDYLKGEDYTALWAKVDKASTLSLNVLSDGMMIGIWDLVGQESGLKDFSVQFEIKMSAEGYKVISYIVL